MNIVGIVIIVLIVLASALGFLIGLIKGFVNVKSWGIEYLIVSLLTVGIGSAVVGSGDSNSSTAVGGIVMILLAIAFTIGFYYLFKLLRSVFKKSLDKKKKLAEEEERKPKYGFTGVLNRLFGAITLGVKGFVIFGLISAFILIALDLSQFAFVVNSMQDLFYGSSYLTFKPKLMDFLLIAVITLAIKCGYQSGITNFMWTIVVVLMVVFAGLASYHLAFNVESFAPAVEKLAATLAGSNENTGMFTLIAKIILTGGIFILMGIVVALVAVFVPKLLGGARDSAIFYVVDGIFGALFATLFVLAVFLIVGGIIQPLNDLSFMEKFTSYFEKSGFATYFYDRNILYLFGIMPELPIRDWLS